MNIAPYAAQNDSALLSLWNACLHHDQLDLPNFYKRIVFDTNFDPQKLLLAWDGQTLAGFAYATCRVVPDEIAGMEEGKGWIVAMGVHPAYRRQRIGTELVARAEKKLRAQGVKTVALGAYSSNYIFPGIDMDAYGDALGFFESLGYKKSGESCSMSMGLHGYRTPEKYVARKAGLEAEGYRFALFTPRDTLALYDFLKRDFPYFMADIRRNIQLGRAERTLILAHDPKGEVAGFVLRGMDRTDERFGPFATRPSLQGIGLGGVLFHEMMENLVRARVFYTYFLWTGGRNLDIYGTWGMKIYRRYAMVGKTLDT